MQPTLHITVATGFVEGRTALDVGHETTLVKAALLYADSVTLASPRVALLSTVASLLNLDAPERAEAALQIVSNLPEGAGVARRIDALRRKKHPTVDERYLLRDLNKELRTTGEQLAETVENLLTEAGVSELARAIEAGVLDLEPLGINEADGMNRIAERLSHLLGEVAAPGSTTYPLLDESTGGMLSAMIREGLVEEPDRRRTTEPAVGTSWIGEMETFPDARMDVILELRDGLRDPLVRYRSAVIEVTRRFQSSVLDADFAVEASQAYREEVEPALLEIREKAREKSITSLLKHELTTAPGRRLTGAAVGFVGATAATMPQLLGTAVGVAGDLVASMYQRNQTLGAEQRANAFFYLYEAEKRLGR
jgi:hypothetical protein